MTTSVLQFEHVFLCTLYSCIDRPSLSACITLFIADSTWLIRASQISRRLPVSRELPERISLHPHSAITRSYPSRCLSLLNTPTSARICGTNQQLTLKPPSEGCITKVTRQITPFTPYKVSCDMHRNSEDVKHRLRKNYNCLDVWLKRIQTQYYKIFNSCWYE